MSLLSFRLYPHPNTLHLKHTVAKTLITVKPMFKCHQSKFWYTSTPPFSPYLCPIPKANIKRLVFVRIMIYLSVLLTINKFPFLMLYYANRSCPVCSALIVMFGVRSALHSSGKFALTNAAGIGGQTAFPHRRTCSLLGYVLPV